MNITQALDHYRVSVLRERLYLETLAYLLRDGPLSETDLCSRLSIDQHRIKTTVRDLYRSHFVLLCSDDRWRVSNLGSTVLSEFNLDVVATDWLIEHRPGKETSKAQTKLIISLLKSINSKERGDPAASFRIIESYYSQVYPQNQEMKSEYFWDSYATLLFNSIENQDIAMLITKAQEQRGLRENESSSSEGRGWSFSRRFRFFRNRILDSNSLLSDLLTKQGALKKRYQKKVWDISFFRVFGVLRETIADDFTRAVLNYDRGILTRLIKEMEAERQGITHTTRMLLVIDGLADVGKSGEDLDVIREWVSGVYSRRTPFRVRLALNPMLGTQEEEQEVATAVHIEKPEDET